MDYFKRKIRYFSKIEIFLWGISVLLIVTSFLVFDRKNVLTLSASLVGVTSLIFNAKGNPFGQFLMIIFSIIYGIISYSFAYYGEMITYLLMTAPMALFALIAWIKNPYETKRSEVKVNRITRKEIFFMIALTITVTLIFYYILIYFNTKNILPSTFSVATSFIAVYLTFKRNPYFALAYASNDVVLIVLWILAAKENISYFSVIICFIIFFVNDIYGFFNWKKIQRRQENKTEI